MGTTIHNNGSKWAGQAPDSVDKLLSVLQEYPLDRTFEDYGNFIQRDGKTVRFWGNFYNLSHVFQIDTDDPDLISRLSGAVRDNQKREDYLSQPSAVEVRKEREKNEARKLALKNQERRSLLEKELRELDR